jgi:hypothetical protein
MEFSMDEPGCQQGSQVIAVTGKVKRPASPELRFSPAAIPALNCSIAPHRTVLLRAREMAV